MSGFFTNRKIKGSHALYKHAEIMLRLSEDRKIELITRSVVKSFAHGWGLQIWS